MKLRIRKSRINKKGESPIFVQIFSGTTKKEVSSGITVNSKYWDNTRSLIKRAHPRSDSLNQILRNKLAEIQSIIDDLLKQSKYFTASDIVDLIKTKTKPKTHVKREITSFLKDYVERNPDNRKESTLLTYGIFINCFDVFKPKFTFDKLNLEVIHEYHKYLANKRLAVNTISNRMKILRRTISLANQHDILDYNPMKGYKRKREEGKREYLTIDEVGQFRAFKATTRSKQKVIDMFLFNVYTGIRIGDLFTMTQKDITRKKGEIRFNLRMNKTGDLITHKLSNSAKNILLKYYNSDSYYIFNILDERKNFDDPKILNKAINVKTSYYNKVLKEAAITIGIDKVITTHCARHTFGTISLTLGIPIEVVSKMLGHKSIRETQIYAKIMDSSKDKAIDLWNRI